MARPGWIDEEELQLGEHHLTKQERPTMGPDNQSVSTQKNADENGPPKASLILPTFPSSTQTKKNTPVIVYDWIWPTLQH